MLQLRPRSRLPAPWPAERRCAAGPRIEGNGILSAAPEADPHGRPAPRNSGSGPTQLLGDGSASTRGSDWTAFPGNAISQPMVKSQSRETAAWTARKVTGIDLPVRTTTSSRKADRVPSPGPRRATARACAQSGPDTSRGCSSWVLRRAVRPLPRTRSGSHRRILVGFAHRQEDPAPIIDCTDSHDGSDHRQRARRASPRTALRRRVLQRPRAIRPLPGCSLGSFSPSSARPWPTPASGAGDPPPRPERRGELTEADLRRTAPVIDRRLGLLAAALPQHRREVSTTSTRPVEGSEARVVTVNYQESRADVRGLPGRSQGAASSPIFLDTRGRVLEEVLEAEPAGPAGVPGRLEAVLKTALPDDPHAGHRPRRSAETRDRVRSSQVLRRSDATLQKLSGCVISAASFDTAKGLKSSRFIGYDRGSRHAFGAAPPPGILTRFRRSRPESVSRRQPPI